MRSETGGALEIFIIEGSNLEKKIYQWTVIEVNTSGEIHKIKI